MPELDPTGQVLWVAALVAWALALICCAVSVLQTRRVLADAPPPAKPAKPAKMIIRQRRRRGLRGMLLLAVAYVLWIPVWILSRVVKGIAGIGRVIPTTCAVVLALAGVALCPVPLHAWGGAVIIATSAAACLARRRTAHLGADLRVGDLRVLRSWKRALEVAAWAAVPVVVSAVVGTQVSIGWLAWLASGPWLWAIGVTGAALGWARVTVPAIEEQGRIRQSLSARLAVALGTSEAALTDRPWERTRDGGILIPSPDAATIKALDGLEERLAQALPEFEVESASPQAVRLRPVTARTVKARAAAAAYGGLVAADGGTAQATPTVDEWIDDAPGAGTPAPAGVTFEELD